LCSFSPFCPFHSSINPSFMRLKAAIHRSRGQRPRNKPINSHCPVWAIDIAQTSSAIGYCLSAILPAWTCHICVPSVLFCPFHLSINPSFIRLKAAIHRSQGQRPRNKPINSHCPVWAIHPAQISSAIAYRLFSLHGLSYSSYRSLKTTPFWSRSDNGN
jgi:hypothetical protein